MSTLIIKNLEGTKFDVDVVTCTHTRLFSLLYIPVVCCSRYRLTALLHLSLSLSQVERNAPCVWLRDRRGARLSPARFWVPSYWNRYDCARRANQKNRILKKRKIKTNTAYMYIIRCLGESLTSKNQRGGKIKCIKWFLPFFITDVIFFLDVWAWKFGASLFVHLPISRLFFLF